MTDAGEIIKSGAFDKLADIIQKLAGPMADEIGLLMADKIKVYRVKNWVNVVKKTERILSDAHLPPNAVPPRLFLPILEASSVENDESLQGLWAGLLATASEKADTLSPSFIETLKQLTPAEAKTFDELFLTADYHSYLFLPYGSKESGTLDAALRLKLDTFERLGLTRREYRFEARQFVSGGIFGAVSGMSGAILNAQPFSQSGKDDLPELTYQHYFTEYGRQFMNAFRGPVKEDKLKGKTG